MSWPRRSSSSPTTSRRRSGSGTGSPCCERWSARAVRHARTGAWRSRPTTSWPSSSARTVGCAGWRSRRSTARSTSSRWTASTVVSSAAAIDISSSWLDSPRLALLRDDKAMIGVKRGTQFVRRAHAQRGAPGPARLAALTIQTGTSLCRDFSVVYFRAPAHGDRTTRRHPSRTLRRPRAPTRSRPRAAASAMIVRSSPLATPRPRAVFQHAEVGDVGAVRAQGLFAHGADEGAGGLAVDLREPPVVPAVAGVLAQPVDELVEGLLRRVEVVGEGALEHVMDSAEVGLVRHPPGLGGVTSRKSTPSFGSQRIRVGDELDLLGPPPTCSICHQVRTWVKSGGGEPPRAGARRPGTRRCRSAARRGHARRRLGGPVSVRPFEQDVGALFPGDLVRERPVDDVDEEHATHGAVVHTAPGAG